MHTFIAEVLAQHFDSTPDEMLRKRATGVRGLFTYNDAHYTCCVKGYTVPGSFAYVSELFYDGAMFTIYRVKPKAYAHFISPRH
jgi:hypothetical protein